MNWKTPLALILGTAASALLAPMAQKKIKNKKIGLGVAALLVAPFTFSLTAGLAAKTIGMDGRYPGGIGLVLPAIGASALAYTQTKKKSQKLRNGIIGFYAPGIALSVVTPPKMIEG